MRQMRLALREFSHLSAHNVHCVATVAYRGGFGGVRTPLPKFRRPSKIVPNSNQSWKLFKIVEFRPPTSQDVWKKGSKILKLPPVSNFFTLAMTNKLVVIIFLYEMKFLVPNYSCLQNPWLGGYLPQIPVLSVLCPQLNLLPPPPRTKFLGTPLCSHTTWVTERSVSEVKFISVNTESFTGKVFVHFTKPKSL